MDVEVKIKSLEVDHFILTGEIKDYDLINRLKEKIKEKVKTSNLNYKTNVKGLFTGFKAFVEDEDFHKFVQSIKKEIITICKKNFYITDAWGNIYFKDGEAIIHNHDGNDSFCGIMYLTEGGPGTYFPQFNMNVNEKIGKFVLFHQLLDHEVKKIDKDIERITIAFNTNLVKDWDI